MRVPRGLPETHPYPIGRYREWPIFIRDGWKWLLLLEFLRFDQCGAFCLNLFKEFCGSTVLWTLVSQFAADGGLEDGSAEAVGYHSVTARSASIWAILASICASSSARLVL